MPSPSALSTSLPHVLENDEAMKRKLYKLSSPIGYLTRDSNENAYSITRKGNVSVASQVIPLVTIPSFGFCHDSLNSLNSVKFIWGKN